MAQIHAAAHLPRNPRGIMAHSSKTAPGIVQNSNLGQSAMNLARPCRESDVLILHAPSDSFCIRFMVPAPKLKQPAGQNRPPSDPAPAPSSVRPPAEKIAGPKVDPMLGGRSLNKEVIQKHLKAGHKMFIRTIPPPLVLASLQADHVYRVTDYILPRHERSSLFNGRGILNGWVQKVTHDVFRQVGQVSHILLHP